MRKLLLLVFSGLWLCVSADAKEVAGVQLPDTTTVQDSVLMLNGAGTRTRFFVKVYVGALYLPARQNTTDGVLAAAGPKSVRLHIVYKEVSADKMNEALNDGFAGNTSAAELEKLQPRIEQFRALIPTVRRGDTVRLDFLRDGTTEVWVNDARRGGIAGADFQRAVLRIWLGDKPADRSLKHAMLGV